MSSRLTEYSFLSLAVKKAAKYVLETNWFADPLEVKSSTASLDILIREIITDFQYPEGLKYEILEVEVPKSIVQEKYKRKFGRLHKTRKLAHLPFKAQVSGIAILMMIADQWEEAFGPADDNDNPILGNRLDCVVVENQTSFRLGSNTTYRFWADDYSTFVSKTSSTFNTVLEGLNGKRRISLLSTDLSNFYPSIDLRKLTEILLSSIGLSEVEKSQIEHFFTAISTGMKSAGLDGLPQGMVASGFFANVYLNSFDQHLIETVCNHPSLKSKNSTLHFYSRYVDDIRVIVSYDPPKSKPNKSIEKHPIFISCNSLVEKYELSVSIAKTHILDLDRNGAKLTEGLLAEHMQDLSIKAYGALIPETFESLAKQFELLFCIDSTSERRPNSDEVQRNKYNPVIDGPGVRPDSRKRFSAGRFRKLFHTYKDCSEELIPIKDRFVSEIFREWKSDPSQIRLLFFVFDLSDYSSAIIRDALDFLATYPDVEINFESKKWIPFIKASIIRTFIDQGSQTNHVPNEVKKLSIESLSQNNPWFLQALSWQLLAVYRTGLPSAVHKLNTSKSMKIQVKRAYDFWRFCMTPHKSKMDTLRNNCSVAKAVPISRESLDHVYKSVFKNLENDDLAIQILIDNFREIQRLSSIVVKSRKARSFGSRLGLPLLNVAKKQNAISVTQKKFSSEKSLLSQILAGRYRDPLTCVILISKVVDAISSKGIDLDELASTGKINPFSFSIRGEEVVFNPKENIAGWSSPDWSSASWVNDELKGANWGWPIGLLIRLCLTNNKSLIYGAPPSQRYSLYFNQSRLCREDGYAPDSLMSILVRLLSWPGALIRPYKTIDEVKGDFLKVQAELADCSMYNIRLLNAPKPTGMNETTKVRLLVAQVFNGLDKDKMLTDRVLSRKMVLYALNEVELRITTANKLKINNHDPQISTVVAFPELSVPKEAYSDIFRFVKKNRVTVLFGAWPENDNRGIIRNSIYWLFPGKDPSGRVDVQLLKQDKIFPIEAEKKKLGVIPADPQIIWRIPFGAHCRVAAINCYELTNIDIKALLSGRVEIVNTIAWNQDVSLFDGQAKSYSYDLYGFVSIINTGLNGGSCVYAPYKGEEHKKQKLHLHGDGQFLVPMVELKTEDFRSTEKSLVVKTPPAGFKVKA